MQDHSSGNWLYGYAVGNSRETKAMQKAQRYRAPHFFLRVHHGFKLPCQD